MHAQGEGRDCSSAIAATGRDGWGWRQRPARNGREWHYQPVDRSDPHIAQWTHLHGGRSADAAVSSDGDCCDPRGVAMTLLFVAIPVALVIAAGGRGRVHLGCPQ